MNNDLFRNGSLSDKEVDLLWERIALSVHKKRALRRMYSTVAAAAIVLIAGGGWFIANLWQAEELGLTLAQAGHDSAKESKVQLILANEQTVDIEDIDAQLRYDKKGELRINKQTVDVGKGTAFNQLIVPAAKRSYIELADGSKMWVNANTRVKYPVTFEAKQREIYVDGEIYIEVFPDKKRPFVVKSNKINVHVLGTKFNFSTYSVADQYTDRDASVVLVEGKVKVKPELLPEVILIPNERLAYTNGCAEVEKVDVMDYISWKDGRYSFDNELFSVVLSKLSRYYCKKLLYDAEVGNLRCSGTLNLSENVQQVLLGLSYTMPINLKIEQDVISIMLNH